MENKNKIWLYTATPIVAVIVVTFYTLIFSNVASKYQGVIQLRDKYILVIYNIRNLVGLGEADYCSYFGNPVSPIRKNVDGKYNYGLIGKLVAVDKENKTISLECSDKKIYKLSTNITDTYQEGWVTINVGVNTKASSPKENPFMFFPNDLERSASLDPYFNKDQLYMAIWTDSRLPIEIYKALKSNPENPVNSSDNYIRSLLRY